MNIREFAEKYQREEDNNFAVACYDQCSVKSLLNSLLYEIKEADMKAWGIGYEEWRHGIMAALSEKYEEADN